MLYQARKQVVENMQVNSTEDNLWKCIIAFQNYPFYTASGLPFTYTLKAGRDSKYTKELFIDRRENSKSLAWSSVKIENNVPEPTAVDGEVETVIEENGRIGNMDKLTQEMADAFIENVYIHAGGRMEIVFKGQDKVTQMCERLLGESVEITEGRARVIKPEE